MGAHWHLYPAGMVNLAVNPSVPGPVPFPIPHDGPHLHPSPIPHPASPPIPCQCLLSQTPCPYLSPYLVACAPIPVPFPILHPTPPHLVSRIPVTVPFPIPHPLSYSPFLSLSPFYSLSCLSVVLVACMSCPNPYYPHCSLLPSLALVVSLCGHLINDNIHLCKMCEVSENCTKVYKNVPKHEHKFEIKWHNIEQKDQKGLKSCWD